MCLRSQTVCSRCSSRRSDEQHHKPGTNVSIARVILIRYSHCCVNLIVLHNCNTQSWYVPLIEQFSDLFIKSHDLKTGFSVIRAFWWIIIIRICEIWSSGERSGTLSLRRAAGTRGYMKWHVLLRRLNHTTVQNQPIR